MKSKNNSYSSNHTIITCILILVAVGLIFNGCASLQEAQQRRDQRLKERRNTDQLLLKPTDATITVNPKPPHGKPHGESDHYSFTFVENLHIHQDFDEIEERNAFAKSSLAYMESLYSAMYDIFGFKPKQKIHIKLHNLYKGGSMIAETGSYSSYIIRNGDVTKNITDIEMDFPLAMFRSHGTRVHELTHAFTNIYYFPVWFSEGIAVLMQTEYANDNSHPKFDGIDRNLRVGPNGINLLEGWRGHGDHQAGANITQWRYRYAYTVVSELRKLYGKDFYMRVFKLMDEDQLYKKLVGRMSTSFVVYYFSQAAGEDLVPFFKKLQFDVRKLEKDDILQQIEKQKELIRRQL